ncbi:MAG: PQQ-binding-like beta-propeller repeat protein [Kiritimatiellae bacterium]|jgi:outer membrane protein assembly factor BamB|nr:PQQ-binding-like beta-propeller repeat protein [Kiritimatiellia bacterium]
MIRTPAILTAALLSCMTVVAQNWPQWRGPEGNGVAAPGKYPVKFSAATDLLWQAPLPGKGGSTPIVWKDRIVITSGVGEKDEGQDGVLCFDWSGKQLWQVTLGKQVKGKHRRGNGSCPSAVTDGKRVFVYFKSGTLAALDFDGKILWQTNLQKRYGKNTLLWDLGTSPVLVDGNVVIAVMHTGSSYVVAFNQETGEERWKVDRNFKCPEESDQSYTTPQVTQEGGRTTLIIWGADHLTSHDAASGAMIWQCGGFNPEQKKAWRVISSPVIAGDIAVVPYGRDKNVAGVKLGGKGDVTKTNRLWDNHGIGTDGATPTAYDGKVYIVNFQGKVSCLDTLTGKELWSSRLPQGKGMFYSSPTLAGDKLYICREKGSIYVCQITPTGLNVINETNLDDHFVASPVLIQDKILLRGEKNLYCIGK